MNKLNKPHKIYNEIIEEVTTVSYKVPSYMVYQNSMYVL